MGTRGSPTSMNLNVNVNLELRQSHAQLHMHHRLTRYRLLSLSQYISPAIELKKLMGHGSTPSDPWPMWPIRFSWPIWPMTHDPLTHSLLCPVLIAQSSPCSRTTAKLPWLDHLIRDCAIVWQCDRHTGRPTDHATRSLTIGRFYTYVVLRCGLIIINNLYSVLYVFRL